MSVLKRTQIMFLILTIATSLPLSNATLPKPPQMQQFETEEDMLRAYMIEGYTYEKMLLCLSLYHSITWSVRKLKQRLKSFNLYRRKHMTPLPIVEDKIKEELTGPNSNVGYREMWRTLQRKYKLVVARNKVMEILRRLDPHGSEKRRTRRLQRRIYISDGPNFTWHMDGFDKLKPYGFAIHGAVDGFSRRVMWLEVCATNNDPAVIAGYYLNCIEQMEGIPKNLRTDPGTENSTTAAIQTVFSVNELSHRFVTSVRNQRIEAWWSYFKRNKAQWMMDYFSDLYSVGIYNPDNRFQKSCFQFCFMNILQKELESTALAWNSHRIRPNTGSCPAGIPNEIYFLHDLYSKSDFKQPINQDQINNMRVNTKPKKLCDDNDVEEYLEYVKSFADWDEPSDFDSALKQYLRLMRLSGEN
ncbi:uncharacterized protein LOC134275889 [Saccostrea cucullata]|uniref:uncharacterized protein LOC134275889 n=1 Tax=Saccostrea cuccullata TaxID=36930 RepID=UPI002ED31121